MFKNNTQFLQNQLTACGIDAGSMKLRLRRPSAEMRFALCPLGNLCEDTQCCLPMYEKIRIVRLEAATLGVLISGRHAS